MNIKLKMFISSLVTLSPGLVFAQQANLTIVNGILNFTKSIVSDLIPIFFGLAIVYFFWGVAMYVRNSGDPKKAEDGKAIMIHGVIAIAVMVSIFGIIAAIRGIFGIFSDDGADTTPPCVIDDGCSH